MSEARLSLTPGGLVRYHPMTPYSDGSVFAPNSAHRTRVTKAGPGKGASERAAAQTDERTPAERRAAMTCPAPRPCFASD